MISLIYIAFAIAAIAFIAYFYIYITQKAVNKSLNNVENAKIRIEKAKKAVNDFNKKIERREKELDEIE